MFDTYKINQRILFYHHRFCFVRDFGQALLVRLHDLRLWNGFFYIKGKISQDFPA
jgi:hypothetical protein